MAAAQSDSGNDHKEALFKLRKPLGGGGGCCANENDEGASRHTLDVRLTAFLVWRQSQEAPSDGCRTEAFSFQFGKVATLGNV